MAENLHQSVIDADADYYIYRRLDATRYDAVVGAAKKAIVELQAEITRLEDILHAARQDTMRSQRVEDIAEVGIVRLNDPDLEAANAWLRRYFRVWVECNEVVAIQIL